MIKQDIQPTTDNLLPTLTTKADIRKFISQCQAKDEKVSLVPTMGALHQGHLSLVETGKKHAERVVVSIFVNPTQFAPTEDFSKYPRNISADIELLYKAGADAVYLPSVKEIYGESENSTTSINISGITEMMEGAVRPTHFSGVALVVTKLLLQCLPDCAVFGEKDYQQLQVINRLVNDLDIPVNVISSPLIRERDGLAMSSRNAQLSEDEKSIAPALYKTLLAISDKITGSPANISQILDWGVAELHSKGFKHVDYLELRDPTDLKEISVMQNNVARLLVAAHLGSVRLLDNIEVVV